MTHTFKARRDTNAIPVDRKKPARKVFGIYCRLFGGEITPEQATKELSDYRKEKLGFWGRLFL